MDPLEIEQMNKLESAYWWHVGRRFVIRSFLKKYLSPDPARSVLDFGCGTGGNLKLLQEFGRVEGADVSPLAVDFCRRKGFENIKLIHPGENLTKQYDLITAFDVLEHIREESDQLKIWRAGLKNQGWLCLTVPAYRFLWSEHDEALQHVRRYVASELRAKLHNAGFDVARISYAVTITFPIFLFYRLLRGFLPKSYANPKTSYVMLPDFLNSLFIWFIYLESKIIKKINLPFGTSIIVIAQKNEK